MSPFSVLRGHSPHFSEILDASLLVGGGVGGSGFDYNLGYVRPKANGHGLVHEHLSMQLGG